MNFKVFLLILFVLYLLQTFASFFQLKSMDKVLKSLKNKGIIGYKQKRSFFKGKIVAIVADGSGKIREYQKMEGASVFARFSEDKEKIGKDVYELLENYKNDKKFSCDSLALEDIIDKLEQIGG